MKDLKQVSEYATLHINKTADENCLVLSADSCCKNGLVCTYLLAYQLKGFHDCCVLALGSKGMITNSISLQSCLNMESGALLKKRKTAASVLEICCVLVKV